MREDIGLVIWAGFLLGGVFAFGILVWIGMPMAATAPPSQSEAVYHAVTQMALRGFVFVFFVVCVLGILGLLLQDKFKE